MVCSTVISRRDGALFCKFKAKLQMATDILSRLEKLNYPTGTFTKVGENLRTLARNESAYTPPVRLGKTGKAMMCPIIVPTNRSVIKNRRNITRLLQLSQERDTNFIVFLCSGEAKKEDIATVAHELSDAHWLAVDGPFLHAHHQTHEFETAHSSIADSNLRDSSQKRNFGLHLARLLGWDSLIFLDDDMDVTSDHIYKATDLLEHGNAAVVGFSARSFPDHSVAVHANRWVNGPIDSFVGSGVLAVKTNATVFSFFPYIYNEDWLFLLVYCLFGGEDVVWAGTIKQRKYDPFKNIQRAKTEEPGDLLAESLARLVMSHIQDLRGKSFDTIARKLVELANDSFWEHEINNRIVFIHETQEKIKRKKIALRKKHRALKALDCALERLMGTDGEGSIQASELSAWVQAWLRDLRYWNKLNVPGAQSANILEAMQAIGFDNKFMYHSGLGNTRPQRPKSQKHLTSNSSQHMVSLTTQRQHAAVRGLQNTKIVQNYLESKKLGLEYIVNSATSLRFDRPAMSLTESKPKLTISMVVAHGESIGIIAESVRDIIGWNQSATAIQLIVWVYGAAAESHRQLNAFRNIVTAQLVREVAGTNLRIRSSIIASTASDIDHVIDNSLIDMAFAYWKCSIATDHQVFVVNSRNELLRLGTFWEFMQQEHRMPRQPLSEYLRHASKSLKGHQPLPITHVHDKHAAAQSRRYLAESPAKSLRSRFPYFTPTFYVARGMKKSKLSWLQLDERAYGIRFHHPAGEDSIESINAVVCVPIKYGKDLVNTKQAVARKIATYVQNKTVKSLSCMIIIQATGTEELSELNQYRQKLMQVVLKQEMPQNIVFTSLVYQPLLGENKRLTKKRILAVARYVHWLQNHKQKLSITWKS